MDFVVDGQIQKDSLWLADWPLSSLYLKNEANFPWLLLVPRVKDAQEIHQLSIENRYQLMDEITALSKIIEETFVPDKLNIAYLGNMVPQLHVHLVARYKEDILWPQGIWQSYKGVKLYSPERLEKIRRVLIKKILSVF
jgi:diadenosine tetraphosphate (Ap4A) HIT family hydrolase